MRTANEDWCREGPSIPFGGVYSIPDFAKGGLTEENLLIEVKLVSNPARLRKIINEIASDITLYTRGETWTLFVVHDPHRYIKDRDKFSEPFVAKNGVKILVI